MLCHVRHHFNILIFYKIECFRLFEENFSGQTKLSVVKMLVESLSDDRLLFTGVMVIL